MIKAEAIPPFGMPNCRCIGLLFFLATWLLVFLAITPDPAASLPAGLLFTLVGFGGAVIGNVTAIGGGLVFIPVLVFMHQIPSVAALKISIATQAFGMTSGALAWNRTNRIPWEVVAWALPGMLIGSTISSLVIHPSSALVKGLFGPVSILLGILLLLTASRRGRARRTWDGRAKAAVVAASSVGGLLTGWVAIGEGEVVAATLMLGFGFAAPESIALGVTLLSINSIYLAILHLTLLGGVPWEIAIFTILGCVFGAQTAPALARMTGQKRLKIIFACVAILDGLLFCSQQFILSPDR
ncbi:MAG: sulfite exporter TauE/SafE family protein [Candidatus Melainabacteria bacterium]|nr:sulfite exporter TauE/SafE family protein [Candidatus Melainabacteria bacterium]